MAIVDAAQTSSGTRRRLRLRSPVTLEPIDEIEVATADDVTAAVARARAAQPAWEALGFEGRRAVMLETRKWLIDNRERMIETVV